MPNLDALLSAEDINASIIAIDTFISELCGYGDELEKLTLPQRNFYFNQNLQMEIANGGFNQFFFNSSGDNVHETVAALKDIGAEKTAIVLQTAIDRFPQGMVPKDRDERCDILSSIEEAATPVWEELEWTFFNHDDLTALNIAYIKKNQDKF